MIKLVVVYKYIYLLGDNQIYLRIFTLFDNTPKFIGKYKNPPSFTKGKYLVVNVSVISSVNPSHHISKTIISYVFVGVNVKISSFIMFTFSFK